MKITIDNKSFKNRNKGKLKTLVGSDEIWMSLLDFELLLEDGTSVNLKEVFEKLYTESEEFKKENEGLKEEIQNIKNSNKELKAALKQYIEQENQVDLATTSSLDILSTELAKINLRLEELESKTKYL